MEKLFVMLMMFAYANENDVQIPMLPELPVQASGIASWYGSGINNDNGLHGQITATGEVFNPARRTCASRSIPLNTTVVVELKRTGKRITCRINDRGPYGAMLDDKWVLKLSRDDPGEWRGVMDLSRQTATDLGFDFNRGMEEITIRYRRKG